MIIPHQKLSAPSDPSACRWSDLTGSARGLDEALPMPSGSLPRSRTHRVGCEGAPTEKALSRRGDESAACGQHEASGCRCGGAEVWSVRQRDRASSDRSSPRAEHGGLCGPLRGPGSSHGLCPWSMTATMTDTPRMKARPSMVCSAAVRYSPYSRIPRTNCQRPEPAIRVADGGQRSCASNPRVAPGPLERAYAPCLSAPACGPEASHVRAPLPRVFPIEDSHSPSIP